MLESPKYILDKISEGEGLHLDFKHSVNDAKKIARAMVAFANSKGGTLLIGVRDNGSIGGVKSEEEFYMIETASILHCKPEVKFDIKNWNINGKNVLEVKVKQSDIKPHTAPDQNGEPKAFFRVDDKNLIAHKILIDTWKRKQKGFAGIKLIYDDVVETLFNEITENGSVSKEQLIRITGIRSSQANKLLTNLLLMDILDIEMTENNTYFVYHESYENEF